MAEPRCPNCGSPNVQQEYDEQLDSHDGRCDDCFYRDDWSAFCKPDPADRIRRG